MDYDDLKKIKTEEAKKIIEMLYKYRRGSQPENREGLYTACLVIAIAYDIEFSNSHPED